MKKEIEKPTSRPTSFDVAKAAGVSRSSVSLVFNHAGGNHVSQANRDRILQAARELGYRPDRVASALRRGYSDEIAFLAAEPPGASVSAEGLVTAQKRAIELGYTMGIYLFYNLSEAARNNAFAAVAARRPIAITGFAPFVTQENWKLAAEMGVQACVLQWYEPVAFAPTQLLQIKEAFYMAGRHLVERGHRHIARLAPGTANAIEQSANGFIQDGLRAAVEGTGVQISEIPMNLNLADASRAVDDLLSSPSHPTGIIGNRDEYCFYFLRALQNRGLHVPRDIALVGINDNPVCELMSPSLTSVSFGLLSANHFTVDIIDAIVKGGEINPEWLLFPQPRLILRESS